jgi:hypothetical protein
MALRGGWDQRASATIPLSCWWGRSTRSAWRRSPRCWRSAWRRWPRSARRVIAHARVLGLAAWLSVCSSTTTRAPSAERRVVLGAPHPLGQLPTRARPDREFAMVEDHKHQVKARSGRAARALAGRVDRPLADGLGVARRHAQPVPGKGFAQRRPGGAQLGRGRVHRAESFGELEGALGLSTLGQEAAGLPAHPMLRDAQAPLVAAGGIASRHLLGHICRTLAVRAGGCSRSRGWSGGQLSHS